MVTAPGSCQEALGSSLLCLTSPAVPTDRALVVSPLVPSCCPAGPPLPYSVSPTPGRAAGSGTLSIQLYIPSAEPQVQLCQVWDTLAPSSRKALLYLDLKAACGWWAQDSKPARWNHLVASHGPWASVRTCLFSPRTNPGCSGVPSLHTWIPSNSSLCVPPNHTFCRSPSLRGTVWPSPRQ